MGHEGAAELFQSVSRRTLVRTRAPSPCQGSGEVSGLLQQWDKVGNKWRACMHACMRKGDRLRMRCSSLQWEEMLFLASRQLEH